MINYIFVNEINWSKNSKLHVLDNAFLLPCNDISLPLTILRYSHYQK